MDQTMINVTEITNIFEGIEVVLLADQGDQSITIYALCQLLNTVPNDILTNISQRVYRQYK